jgi:hypothetical protein
MDRLIGMIERAYTLALQAQDGEADAVLAEEVSGECAEFLALWNDDMGSFGDDECIDPEIQSLVKQLKTTIGEL